MALVKLEGIRFEANQGVYDEEKEMGGVYIVDVELVNLIRVTGDNIYKTINYETVYHLVKQEIEKPANLLETVAGRIMDSLKYQFRTLKFAQVRVRKINPIMGANIGEVYVEIDSSHQKECANCGEDLLCYKDVNCWCHNIRVSVGMQEFLKEKFKGCLCANCLNEYGG